MAEAVGDFSGLESLPRDPAEHPLTWDLVEADPFALFELRAGDHRYAALRRPPREGWLWSWQWIAETATSRWAIRSGGCAFIRARDRITDMATGALLGVFRSWFISSGVLELAEGEFFHWKAPWRQDRHFADEEGNRQVTFKRCKDALGPYCCVDLVNLTPRSGHRLLLCCLGLHLLLDPPGQRWAVQGFGG